jgi:hypothetical protein
VPRKKMLTILRNRKSAAACRSTIVELKAELARCQLELNLRDQIAELLHAPATPVGDGRPLDLSGDGLADAVGYDTNGDGRVDALDTNGDGKIDSKIMVRSCLPAFLLACLPACCRCSLSSVAAPRSCVLAASLSLGAVPPPAACLLLDRGVLDPSPLLTRSMYAGDQSLRWRRRARRRARRRWRDCGGGSAGWRLQIAVTTVGSDYIQYACSSHRL